MSDGSTSPAKSKGPAAIAQLDASKENSCPGCASRFRLPSCLMLLSRTELHSQDMINEKLQKAEELAGLPSDHVLNVSSEPDRLYCLQFFSIRQQGSGKRKGVDELVESLKVALEKRTTKRIH